MEGSTMKCGEGVKGDNRRTRGKVDGVVRQINTGLFHLHLTICVPSSYCISHSFHCTLIVISWSRILQLVTIPIDGSSSVFSISVFFKTSLLAVASLLAVECLCCSIP